MQILFQKDDILHLFNENIHRIEVSKEVYQKLAYRDATEGIIAVVKTTRFRSEKYSI